jgi:hypothetical protein
MLFLICSNERFRVTYLEIDGLTRAIANGRGNIKGQIPKTRAAPNAGRIGQGRQPTLDLLPFPGPLIGIESLS